MPTIYSFLKDKKNNQRKIVINSLKEYLEFVAGCSSNNYLIFRGIKSECQKYPLLVRNNLTHYEEDILKDFERIAYLYSSPTNFWDVITLAQHNGLSTRLIDFTTNINVATFFSLYHYEDDKECIVYVADKTNYSSKEDTIKTLINVELKKEKPFSQDLSAIVYKLNGHSAVVIDTNFTSQRMFAQQGLFLMPIYLDTKSIDKLYEEMPIILKFTQNARKEIINYLDANGFTEYKLMPDLHSSCSEINHKYQIFTKTSKK